MYGKFGEVENRWILGNDLFGHPLRWVDFRATLSNPGMGGLLAGVG